MTTDKTTESIREPYDAMGPVDAPNPPTARATLADVQPGGRVRLGDQEFAQGCDELRMRTDGERSAYLEGVAEGRRAALSAQPSPGGQGALAAMDRLLAHVESLGASQIHPDYVQDARTARAALAARQPVRQITDTEIDARLNALYREMVDSGQHNGGMSGVAWDRAVYRMASNQPSGNSGELDVDGARQPVGEPVAWYYGFSDTGEAGPVTFGGNPGAEAIAWAERHGHTLHYLYAAPPAKQPAKAVDLGAVREALQAAEGLATVCASVDGYSREEVAASGRAMRQQFADALAKVDSQAVGNG